MYNRKFPLNPQCLQESLAQAAYSKTAVNYMKEKMRSNIQFSRKLYSRCLNNTEDENPVSEGKLFGFSFYHCHLLKGYGEII